MCEYVYIYVSLSEMMLALNYTPIKIEISAAEPVGLLPYLHCIVNEVCEMFIKGTQALGLDDWESSKPLGI